MSSLLIAIFGAACVYLLYEQISFHLLISKANKLSQQSLYNEAITHLHSGLGRKLLTVPSLRSQLYYAIAFAYLSQKDYVSAGKYFEHLVNQPSQFHKTDAAVRLEECRHMIKAQGKTGVFVSQPSNQSAACLEKGHKLHNEGRSEEAYAEYLRGYNQIVDGDTLTKHRLIAHLSTQAVNCGKLEKAVYWAEQDVRNSSEPNLPFTTNAMGCLASNSLGDFERAQQFCRQGHLYATECGDKVQVGRFMGFQSVTLLERGRVREAAKLTEAAVTEMNGSKHTKTVYIVWAKALMTLGDNDGALALLEDALNVGKRFGKSASVQMDTSVEIVKVQAFIGKGELDRAMELIERLLPETDSRTNASVNVKFLKAKVYARQGKAQEALDLLARTRQIIETKMPGHRALNMAGMASTASVYFYIGDVQQARDVWKMYLSLMPTPIKQQKAYYELGRCCETVGDTGEALAFYQKCVDTGIDSVSAYRSREKLTSLSAR
jgi:tetratricopeptide (TPR) repeat protein